MGRVLVPLCGKSLDMVFLAERADAVVGVEFVEKAVSDFFVEHDLAPDVDAGPPTRYHADRYTLFAADFFAVTEDHVGRVDAVFDRAALVALEPAVRIRYADQMRSHLRAGVKMLLITFDYDQSKMNGPPFAVSDGEVHRLFADSFAIKHLETRSVLEERFRERGVSTMTESAFALTRI